MSERDIDQLEHHVHVETAITCVDCGTHAIFSGQTEREGAKEAFDAGWRVIAECSRCPGCVPNRTGG